MKSKKTMEEKGGRKKTGEEPILEIIEGICDHNQVKSIFQFSTLCDYLACARFDPSNWQLALVKGTWGLDYAVRRRRPERLA